MAKRRVTEPTISRILVVLKRSAYDYYIRRYKMPRVRALLRAKDPSVTRLLRADAHHSETVTEVRDALTALGLRARFRDRSQIGNIDGFDLVITIGGDGTLLSASHLVGTTPLFGINSAPLDSVGYLCSARRGNVRERLKALLAGHLTATRLSRMRVTVDGKVVFTRALNDVLYAHKNPAMTSRYVVTYRDVTEDHKSSGLWIATAAGSTAAIHSAGGRVLSPRSRMLQFVVREPYNPPGERYTTIKGLIRPNEPFEILNKMRQAVLYIDGPRTVFLVEIGQHIHVDLSPEPLTVLGFRHEGAEPG